MMRIIIYRLLIFIPTLVVISLISFCLIQLPPGSFADVRIMELEQTGLDVSSQKEINQIRQRYGLDKPVYRQYLIWVKNIVLHGDFGESFIYRRNVTQVLGSYLGYTLLISGTSFLVTYLLAMSLALYAVFHQGTWRDGVIGNLAFLGMSIPPFMLALILLVFAILKLNLFLVGLHSPNLQFAPWNMAKIKDLLMHMMLPVGLVSFNGAAGLMRIVRGNMIEALGQQFIRTARARGLTRRRVYLRHAARVALNPVISIIGLSLPGIFSGSAIISIVLNLQTADFLLYESLLVEDVYLAGAIILMLATLLLIGNLLADIGLAILDPRIRHDRA